jgi:predicted transcriptional regulator
MMLNRYLVSLLMQFDREGHVTRKSQKVYISVIGFYLAIKWLKERDLVECDGMDKENYKTWRLTKKGAELVKLLKKMEVLTAP